MNIFSKSAKKSLVWKALNVLVVFSLVSSYALPLVPTVRAEEGVDVATSDSPSVESSESNDENRDDAEVSEENGSSEETSEETTNEDEAAGEEEVTDDTTTEVEVTDDTSEEESGGGEESSNTNEEEGSVLGESVNFVENTNGNGGPGSIWTTDGSCGANQQNENDYEAGDHVFINGSNFNAGQYNWNITGQPGSSDPNLVVASGVDYVVGANGEFCFDAYTVLAGDDGVYKAEFGNKN
ncbi:MAG: hypothetical protein QG669_19, partial [Patescibacteria group bacterium]|nr:hypothetical protein [Patescibacteria group bacterium]